MNLDYRVVVGEREVWGGTAPFTLSRADRRQHTYVVGKTGTGKSTLLRNMILADIEAGEGVGLIDPHGDLAQEILDHIPPRRVRDVVLFDPTDRDYPVGFNLLRSAPKERGHLVASGIVSAFKSVWRDSWGPRLEYLLYASVAALACVENATILGAQRMVTDSAYRRWVLRQVDDPMVRAFWEMEFEAWDPRFLAEVIAPMQNKVGQLVMSPVIRNIVGQVRSRLKLRDVMDCKGIFIANLSKGQLGEDKSALLGALLVSAFELAAMSRAEQPAGQRNDWFLYVDEFQNFATDSFATILSEARKYGLGLTLSHQYTSQLQPAVRDAVFGNVGTMISFRVSESDASLLAREYGDIAPSAFCDLANYEARVRPVHDGQHVLVHTLPSTGAWYGRRESIRNWSRAAYGTERAVVERRMERWLRNGFTGNGRGRARRRTPPEF